MSQTSSSLQGKIMEAQRKNKEKWDYKADRAMERAVHDLWTKAVEAKLIRAAKNGKEGVSFRYHPKLRATGKDSLKRRVVEWARETQLVQYAMENGLMVATTHRRTECLFINFWKTKGVKVHLYWEPSYYDSIGLSARKTWTRL